MDNQYDVQVTCPVCGFDYVHFEQPEYRGSNDISGVAWSGRGDAIYIPMWCENDHKWNLVFGFHKGYTFTYTEVTETSKKIKPFTTKSAN